jgi:hypothetical protein
MLELFLDCVFFVVIRHLHSRREKWRDCVSGSFRDQITKAEAILPYEGYPHTGQNQLSENLNFPFFSFRSKSLYSTGSYTQQLRFSNFLHHASVSPACAPLLAALGTTASLRKLPELRSGRSKHNQTILGAGETFELHAHRI